MIMKKLKKLTFFLLSSVFVLMFLFNCTLEDSGHPNVQDFQNPESSNAVHTWWHWMNSAITKEGITRDLESMKEHGISTATIVSVTMMRGADFGVAPAIFNSEEWYDRFKWSLEEADRIGMKIGVANCDGFATSGGPWVNPENSMKRCTWSKIHVSGGETVEFKLPVPANRHDYYRDINLLAYRSNIQDNSFKVAAPQISVNSSSIGDRLFDGNPFSMVQLEKGSTVDIEFPEPFTADKIALHCMHERQFGDVRIEVQFSLKVSMDGKKYHEIGSVIVPRIDEMVIKEIPSVEARFFQLVVTGSDDLVFLGEMELLKKDETPNYDSSIPSHLAKTVVQRGSEQSILTDDYTPSKVIHQSEIIDLTGKMNSEGWVSWDAPEGDWTILRMGYTTTGAMNGPASRAGRGLEIDKMDTTALNLHFTNFPMKLIEHAGDYTGEVFQHLLVDSWECGYQNWTGKFTDEFEKRRGYSIITWLPVISGEIIEDVESTERFLQDYRKTVGELFEENYYKHYSSLCHRYGLQLHAEPIYGGGGLPPIDVIKVVSYFDMPMNEFWSEYFSPDKSVYIPVGNVRVNTVADAGTLYGKSVIGTEAYTGFANYSESPWDMKLFGDNAFSEGLNQMILHSYVHQPFDKIPGMTLDLFGKSFNRHIPWWHFSSSWFTYQRRIQYILQQGIQAKDILCFVGDRLYDTSLTGYKVPSGYGIQKCNLDILANHSRVKNGKILLDNGLSYELLVLPNDPIMELNTLKVIAKLVKEGATIVGPKPVKSLTHLNYEENHKEFKKLASSLWGDEVKEMPEYSKYLKGRVFTGTAIQPVLDELGLKPQFAYEKANQPLLYIHKKLGNDEVFFVVNQQNESIEQKCSFRSNGKYPEIWDPAYGTVTVPAEYEELEGITTMNIRFEPKEALFFIFKDKKPADLLEERKEAVEVFQLDDFTGLISFDRSDTITPLPIKHLQSLTEYENPSVKYFAGIANYRITFDLPLEVINEKSIFLSPGGFNASCELEINGHVLGDSSFPMHRFDVTGFLKEKDNILKVRVGNNYLRNVWTSSPVQQFLNKTSQLQESGLTGPIKFYSLN